MEDYYDITESLFSAKANEGMIAFAGFTVAIGANVSEGVLKVAASGRTAHGYLTLTFVIDLEAEPGRKAALEAAFSRANQDALAERLGSDFEMLLDVPLNPFAESPRFFVEELNIYFQRLAGRERWVLEAHVLPALADLMGLRFEPLDWLDAPGDALPAAGSGQASAKLSEHLRRQLHGRAPDTRSDPEPGSSKV